MCSVFCHPRGWFLIGWSPQDHTGSQLCSSGLNVTFQEGADGLPSRQICLVGMATSDNIDFGGARWAQLSLETLFIFNCTFQQEPEGFLYIAVGILCSQKEKKNSGECYQMYGLILHLAQGVCQWDGDDDKAVASSMVDWEILLCLAQPTVGICKNSGLKAIMLNSDNVLQSITYVTTKQ